MAMPFKILCVDDDRSILTIIELALKLDPDIEVRGAGDAFEALALLTHAEWTPDCIMLDGKMPGQDGTLLFGEIRNLPGFVDTPVIFLTASVTKREVARFLALGACGVIAKPFDPIALGGKVRRLAGI
jgi:CheY-like chemotaxis protein